MIQPCQTPLPLKSGDLLRVIAPSGRLRERTALDRGIRIWRDRGYRVEVAEDVTQAWGYLAGSDVTRRDRLAAAWADPDCRGILCARGGYGGMRLLEDWQWKPSDRPKWLIGFSDITALLWSLDRAGFAGGVHGPLVTTLSDEPEWSCDRLFKLVTGAPLPPLQGDSWVSNVATGKLLPCNLTVATHLLGTLHQPDLAGTILAIEDVTEAPYRIDRLLTHWRLTGALHRVAGIAIGRFSQCDPPEGSSSFTVEEVLRDRLTDLQIPIVANLPFGHDGCNAALPVGVEAILDGNTGELKIV
ncbi:S66 peptidase family protein [Chamaesiphon minutus]|uniref:Putative MccF-like protein (Microcin C7 resistance) n=1 Tax=Chamaesiphon minutus (strain ATCC 27169 / PCC 6605) TaxID=1173020 RepID=K9UKE9_CHAP6|nr:LD-carboxypeptidase [Chamaesiphon minutus]AFY94679.1 putative MccF-like protein (microcin C7 resistance) [Chamaesiphon minutus PCC 6605]